MKSPSNCRKRQDNEDNERNFLDQEYYLTFYEFFHVMIRIKQFIIYVSKLQGVKKFFLTVSIKSQFNSIINDFETSMKERFESQILLTTMKNHVKLITNILLKVLCSGYKFV